MSESSPTPTNGTGTGTGAGVGEPASSSPPPENGSTTVIDLGAVDPGTEVSFNIPPNALGFNVTVIGDPMWNVGIESLISPSGAASVLRYFPDGSKSAVALGGRGLGSISVPQTNTTATHPLETGSWRLVASGIVVDPSKPTDKSGQSLPVGQPVTQPLHVSVSIQRSGDGQFHGGALDLHVYVPAGLRVQDPDPVHEVSADADAASKDASLNRRIDLFYAELTRLFGIDRGTVLFHSIDAKFLTATTGDARASLMAAANVKATQALHVVLTNRLSYSEGSPLLGYSVGMPGAPNSVSLVRSSIAVALYDDQPASNDAITILHEMGHFVGLMHSTEEDGTTDLLADTPACSLDVMERNAKNCPDVDNLMTPMGPLHAAIVSPSQVRVMRGSAIYRASAR